MFSRYAVGWMVALRANAELAKRLIRESCDKEGIEQDQLTIHADRGSPMKAKTTGQRLADLGVTKSHSRPHASNDNPSSKSHFKTFKYRPGFPERFGCRQDALRWSRVFFTWYNQDHRHSAIAMLTPEMFHRGQAAAVLSKRYDVALAACRAPPERFVNGPKGQWTRLTRSGLTRRRSPAIEQRRSYTKCDPHCLILVDRLRSRSSGCIGTRRISILETTHRSAWSSNWVSRRRGLSASGTTCTGRHRTP